MASVDGEGIAQLLQAVLGVLVARVDDPAVSLRADTNKLGFLRSDSLTRAIGLGLVKLINLRSAMSLIAEWLLDYIFISLTCMSTAGPRYLSPFHQ